MQIHNIIKEHGYISVHDFIKIANEEYYASNPVFGKDGDFITAPEISQIFGELIGLWGISEIEQLKGNAQAIALIELGAGRGTLMSDALRIIRQFPSIYNKIEVHIIENSEQLISLQKNALDGHNCHWHKDINNLPEMPSIFIANEFFDALPIEQLVYKNNEWKQRIITSKENELSFNLGDTACQNLLALISAELAPAHENNMIEISPQTIDIFKQISLHIKKNNGAGIFIDYGYAHENYGDSLQAVKHHKFTNPLENVGQSDLTSHVNFASLKRAATEAKISSSKVITQGEWLNNMDINFRAQQLIANCKNINQQADIINACNRLTAPHLMGELFKVIAIGNNDNFTGFK